MACGRFSGFDEKQEDWIQYTERLQYFFSANEIENDVKKRAILLTVIGPAAYKLLRNLVAPERLEDKSYDELVEAMKKHQNPTPSEIVQRYKFNSRFRQSGESVSTFMSELRALAEFCNYGATLDSMLRDRLVCGINDAQIQRRLLSEDKLTFKNAMEIALAMEAAAQNAKTLQGSSVTAAVTPGEVLKVAVHKPGATKQSMSPCTRCGKAGHHSSKCRFKDAILNATTVGRWDTSRRLVSN